MKYRRQFSRLINSDTIFLNNFLFRILFERLLFCLDLPHFISIETI